MTPSRESNDVTTQEWVLKHIIEGKRENLIREYNFQWQTLSFKKLLIPSLNELQIHNFKKKQVQYAHPYDLCNLHDHSFLDHKVVKLI